MEKRQDGPTKVIIPASLYKRLKKEGHDMRLYQPTEMVQTERRMGVWGWTLLIVIVVFVSLASCDLYDIVNHPGR